MNDNRPQLNQIEVQHRPFARNKIKTLIEALKNKKRSRNNIKENLRFMQSWLNYTNRQIGSNGVGVVT